jgi:hypothetical protein
MGRPWQLVVALLLGAAAFPACSASNVKSGDIRSRPEVQLHYPDSQVIQASGRDESWGLDSGTYAAYWQVQLKANAAPAEIYAWYRQELKAKGWTFRRAADEALGSADFYSKGTRDLFLVWAGYSKDDPGAYAIQYYVQPAPCATSPASIELGNCA